MKNLGKCLLIAGALALAITAGLYNKQAEKQSADTSVSAGTNDMVEVIYSPRPTK